MAGTALANVACALRVSIAVVALPSQIRAEIGAALDLQGQRVDLDRVAAGLADGEGHAAAQTHAAAAPSAREAAAADADRQARRTRRPDLDVLRDRQRAEIGRAGRRLDRLEALRAQLGGDGIGVGREFEAACFGREAGDERDRAAADRLVEMEALDVDAGAAGGASGQCQCGGERKGEFAGAHGTFDPCGASVA